MRCALRQPAELSSPNTRLAKVLENFHEQSQESAPYAVGLLAAALAVTNPPLLLAVVVGVVSMHRGLLLPQFRTASRTAAKTGFYTLGARRLAKRSNPPRCTAPLSQS